MSNRLFTASCPVIRARRRVRRTWLATLLAVLTLLALSALAGWLLWLVKATLEVSSVRFSVSGPLPLGMAATGAGMSPWVATVVAWGVVHAWRRVMEWHAVGEFVDELQRASAGEERDPKCSVLSAQCSESASRMCQCGAMGVEKHAGRAEWMCELCAFFEAPAEAGTTNTEPAEAGTTNGEGRAAR